MLKAKIKQRVKESRDMQNIIAKESSLLASVLYVASGVLLFALASNYKIPYYWVPVTLQTLVVSIMAWTYPKRLAAMTLLVSYSLACTGLPILAANIASIGPRLGYLIGFLVACEFINFMKNRGIAPIICFIITQLLTLIIGFIVLSQYIGISLAWRLGVLPFIAPELIKSILACYLVTVCDFKPKNKQG